MPDSRRTEVNLCVRACEVRGLAWRADVFNTAEQGLLNSNLHNSRDECGNQLRCYEGDQPSV